MKYIKKHLSTFVIILLFLIPSFVLFWQFFPRDLFPYPGNYMVAWYEPWKTDHFVNGTITIPHKPVADDVFRQIFPLRTLGVDLLKKDEPPLWNPYSGAGMPLVATNNIGILSPFNLIFFFLPNYLAWSFYISIQPIFILFFTYLFCRRLNLGKYASFSSAFIFALSGTAITRYIYGIYGISFSLLPLGLFCIESMVQNPTSRYRFLLPLVIALVVISTQPQIAFYVILFFLIFFIYRKNGKFSQNLLKNYISFIFLFFLGIGITAIQEIPTFKLYLYANMTKESSSFIFNSFLLKPMELITIFIPNYFGNPSVYNYWGRVDYIQTAIYIGLLPVMFVFIALFKRKKMPANHVLFFIFSLLITIFLTMDNFVTRALYSLPIPIISTGIPERVFLISSLCLSVLAGYGINYWVQSKDALKTYIKPVGLTCIIMVGILLTTLLIYRLNISCPSGPIINCRLISFRNTLLESGVFIAGLLMFLAYFFTKTSFKKFLIYALVLIIITIGLYNGLKFIPYSSSDSFNPQNDLITRLQTYQDSRVFGLGSATIATDLSTLFRFYEPQYYHPLYIRRYGELVSYGNSESKTKTLARSDVIINNTLTLPKAKEFLRQRLLDVLGVGYVFYKKSELPKTTPYVEIAWENKDWVIYKNETAVPRMYFVTSYKVLNSDEKILDYLFSPDFKPLEQVVLEYDPQVSGGGSKNTIISQRFLENSVEAKISTDKTALLVINDNYYSGWKAYIDGKETAVYRANYSFRSIVVPPGTHTLKMVYDPLAFEAGLYITIFFLSFYFLFTGYSLLKKKRS